MEPITVSVTVFLIILAAISLGLPLLSLIAFFFAHPVLITVMVVSIFGILFLLRR